MTTYLITRHPGALDWVMHQGLVIDCVLEHLEPSILEALQPGDIVIGSLPIHLVAQVCARGAHFVIYRLNSHEGYAARNSTPPPWSGWLCAWRLMMCGAAPCLLLCSHRYQDTVIKRKASRKLAGPVTTDSIPYYATRTPTLLLMSESRSTTGNRYVSTAI